MYIFKFLITLLNLVYYGNGCLKTSAVQVGPTITTGTMFTTTTTTGPVTCQPATACTLPTTGVGVTVTGPTLDSATCEYLIVGSCTTAPRDTLTVNADPALTPSTPQTFTCASSGPYFYTDVSLGAVSATSLDCECLPRTCIFFDADPSVTVNGPTPDANCVYMSILTCDDPATPTLRFNLITPEFLPPPQTVTCMAGSYYYNGITGPRVAATVRCV